VARDGSANPRLSRTRCFVLPLLDYRVQSLPSVWLCTKPARILVLEDIPREIQADVEMVTRREGRLA
jgi:hypothetical protein